MAVLRKPHILSRKKLKKHRENKVCSQINALDNIFQREEVLAVRGLCVSRLKELEPCSKRDYLPTLEERRILALSATTGLAIH